MKEFLLEYIMSHQKTWRNKPKLIHGDDFQDCLILVFGKPRTAVYAHMDSIGFTVRYEDQLVPVGSPDAKTGYKLKGNDRLGPIRCELIVDNDKNLRYKFGRPIQRGTNLVFECEFIETSTTIQSCYLDNRLGIYNCLKLAETLEDGVIVFSCYEEHGGGSVPYIARFLYENYKIRQSLISDITWVTDGVAGGEGTVISMRDHNIPRREFLNRIIALAEQSEIPFQLEVESSGSSDGRELQLSPYPIDWCFIGAPELNAHSPEEKVWKNDISAMTGLYSYLMTKL